MVFVSIRQPELNLSLGTGKYVGNRPITLSKVKDDKFGTIDTVTVSGRKVGTAEPKSATIRY